MTKTPHMDRQARAQYIWAILKSYMLDECSLDCASVSNADDKNLINLIMNSLPQISRNEDQEYAETMQGVAHLLRTDSALRHYADTYCEGWCKDAPCNAKFDDCGGCLARIALQSLDPAQGAVSCGVTDQDKIETLQKLIAEYKASTTAGAKADVAAHGLPGARGQRSGDRDEVVWLKEIDAGTDNACWIISNRVDQDSVPFFMGSAYSVTSTDGRCPDCPARYLNGGCSNCDGGE